ncbi:MAG: hypothetical protein M3452_01985 [Chloroflexota bacterium]|nr:hypothetical protein [Chloroflexota bacterium]
MTALPSEPAAPVPKRSSRSSSGGAEGGQGSLLVATRGGAIQAGRVSRRSLALSGSILLVVWLVLVFGSALADVDAAERRAQQARADSAELQVRLEQGRAEIALLQTDAFLRLQARAYGMGERGERAFALEAGAPLIDPIVPLGTSSKPPAARSPLEDWLQLFFG